MIKKSAAVNVFRVTDPKNGGQSKIAKSNRVETGLRMDDKRVSNPSNLVRSFSIKVT